MKEFVVQVWHEGNSSYRVIAVIRHTTITLTKWSMRHGNHEWLPENQCISLNQDNLVRVLRDSGVLCG